MLIATMRRLTLLAMLASTTAAHAAPGYPVTRPRHYAGGNFGPAPPPWASDHASGDVAFKGTRSAPDGLSSWDVIARVNGAGEITIIAEDPDKAQFQFFSNFVSINDSGQVAFGAFLSSGDMAILRADGTSQTTIATTAGAFSSFGFDVSLNDAGEVAFTGQLDTGENGLFSGSGGAVTTHHTSATPVLVDGVTTSLQG